MQQIIDGTPDPFRGSKYTRENTVIYLPNRFITERSGKWRLASIADTCKYRSITAGGRQALDLYDSSANTVKLTYSMSPTLAVPFESLGLNDNFRWAIAMWVYCGPEDFTGNITGASPNNFGQYLGTFNFFSKSAYVNQHKRIAQQMRIHIGRGSTTTLALACGRYKYNDSTGSWTAMKTNKSSNLTMSKGWHLVWVKPLYDTPSTLVWGIDGSSFTNVTSFFNTDTDWPADYICCIDACISCGNKTNNLPRGPYRVFNAAVPTTDLIEIAENDIW